MLENSVEEVIRKNWSKETSSDPDNWTLKKPGWGQSEATALVMNDYLGGEIVDLHALIRGPQISCYLNIIKEDENAYKILEHLFSKRELIYIIGRGNHPTFNSARKYLLSNKNINSSYEILKKRVDEDLKSEKF
ncbi:MAG TPA: hypothetical protein VEC16_07055 [Alphaproteobacteria bacterium]|nr:hypothetical protein [Alphaproteobacteria bacterium]